jgi:hypothetical protein
VEWIFDKPLDQLTLDDVRAFLNEAGHEPLTWEVKGDEREGRWIRAPQVLQAVCAFANSDRGGVLLIGGHKRRGPVGWDFPGLLAPHGEPGPILENWLRTGFVRPPRTQVATWVEGEHVAAAIAVWPTSDPPCVTRDGQVFQRTSGESVTVRDPVVLARLVDAGRGAWEGATARVDRATRRLLEYHDDRPAEMQAGQETPFYAPTIARAVSSTGLPENVGLLPFVDGTAQTLAAVADQLPHDPTFDSNQRWHWVDQDTHAWTVSRRERTWTVMVHREGTAGVAYGTRFSGPITDLGGEQGPICLMWSTAVDLLQRVFDAAGRGRMRLRVEGDAERFRGNNLIVVERAIELADPSATDVASVIRELQRAAGEKAMEPPTTPPTGPPA